MKGWKALALAGAVGLSCVALAPHAGNEAWAAGKSGGETVAVKKSAGMRQFTGYVTALDKDKFTVEKRGKKPQSKTFSKHADLKTTGEVEKDARVTVYYRDEGGRSVAHRVVVKAEVASKNRG